MKIAYQDLEYFRMLDDSSYDDRLIFPIMPPGIKLSDQRSFRLSNLKGKIDDLVDQLSRHRTALANHFQQGLLLQHRGRGGRLKHSNNQVRERVHQGVPNALLHGEGVSSH